nr:hypothetical protein XACLG97_7640005 [Xanthomonas citri pv. citri]
MRHLPLSVVGFEVPTNEESFQAQGKPTVIYLSFAPSLDWKQAFNALVDETGGELAAALPLVIGNRIVAYPCLGQAANVASQLREAVADPHHLRPRS